MTEIKFKIEIPEGITFQDIVNNPNLGQFIVYEYLLPRPIIPIKRISRIYFLKNEEKRNKYALKYNIISLFLGPLGMPFGLYYTYLAIKHNATGTDFTEDVIANLTQTDFDKKRVVLTKFSTIFIYPDKSTLKEINKSFQSLSKVGIQLSVNPFVGYYIDTESPYYIIGLSESDTDKIETIKKVLYKNFYSHIKFEFIILDDEEELSQKLRQQGVAIHRV
ncbi:MAG: hypothetical protein QM535_13845 [Limnohabitans sp.]|nr:hypothetical protein [Limnohabitans sp.]